MNLEKLFGIQKELDAEIERNHPTVPGEDRLEKKRLALVVEVGELANETPEVFKFWSNKTSKRERVLAETIDIWHFVLSIGNDLKIDMNEIDYRFRDKPLTAELFLDFIDQARITYVEKQWYWLFRLLGELTLALGFTDGDIETAYLSKNVENHRRQQVGY